MSELACLSDSRPVCLNGNTFRSEFEANEAFFSTRMPDRQQSLRRPRHGADLQTDPVRPFKSMPPTIVRVIGFAGATLTSD
jgi:hypothetical protein